MAPRSRLSDAEFRKLWEEGGSRLIMEATNNKSERSLYKRRRLIEERYNIRLNSPDKVRAFPIYNHPERIHIEVKTGIVLVASDAHYWPGPASVAHRAFVKFSRDFRPVVIIQNGDVADFPGISRHPPIGWTRLPEVFEEIEAIQDRLDEIEKAKPVKCRTIWTLGNHDQRFETRIATHAPELRKVHGTSLKDHFPHWEGSYSVWINGDGPSGVVVKHRFKGGIHAPHNNTMWAGRSIVTGHLHSAKVVPFSDYNGTRYGVDTGCLADPYGIQFEYTEDNPKNWRSGFGVLTFKDGELLMPELVTVWDENTVQFRGELIKV